MLAVRVLPWALCALTVRGLPPRKPHIFFVIVDDLGWGNVGYHRTDSSPEVKTPHIDELVREGLELNRHYVHMTCTPSRTAFQSGRLPVHVITELAGPCDKNGAMPKNMTGIASVLKEAGYATHHVGKWDVGMTTPAHTPQGRGYDSSLAYFSHATWMYTQGTWLGSYNHRADIPAPTIIDFWDTDRPARHLNGTGYEEDIFKARIEKILKSHDRSKPLFLQYDSKLAHYPLQAPFAYEQLFSNISFPNRRVYAAMVKRLDDQLKSITDLFKELEMWEDTLMVLTSDNGGFVRAPLGGCNFTEPGASTTTDWGHGTACFNGEAGASNFPLRGGKYSSFEGGIRSVAFMSGGHLPQKVRGGRREALMHIADWYRTLAEGVAGLQGVEDEKARAAGLPPLDSVNMWEVLMGGEGKEREGLLVTRDLLLKGAWKYVRGVMKYAERGGPRYPNETTQRDAIEDHVLTCPERGCLFNVVDDPEERLEVGAEHPEVLASMRRELAQQAEGIWQAEHGEDPACSAAARDLYGGFYGPWRELGERQLLV